MIYGKTDFLRAIRKIFLNYDNNRITNVFGQKYIFIKFTKIAMTNEYSFNI